jgi:hypothetical protein
MTQPELTIQQEEALASNHGFVHGPSYVLMSIDVYREIMGVGSDAELAESLAAIDEGMADIHAGRTLSLEEAVRRLNEKYGVHR